MRQFTTEENFPSVTFRKVLACATDRELPALLRQVQARPAAIKRIPAARAARLISIIDDVELLARISGTSDQRVAVRDALRGHPLAELLWYQYPPVADSLVGVAPDDEAITPFLRGTESNAVSVLGWVRSLDPSLRGDAVRQLFRNDPSRHMRSATHLLLDTALGLVPNLSVAELRAIDAEAAKRRPGSRSERLPSIVGRLPNHALNRLTRLDAATVHAIVDLGCPYPERPIEHIDQDAVTALLAEPRGLLWLTRHGLVDDDTVIAAAWGLDDDLLVSLLQVTTSGPVAEALLALLSADTLTAKGSSLAGRLLEHAPGLSTAARLRLLRHADRSEYRTFFGGAAANMARPGEAAEACRAVLRGETRLTASELCWVVERYHDQPGSEPFEVLLTHGPARDVLRRGGKLGTAAIARLRAALGNDEAAWQTAATLLSQWSDTIDTLARAVKLV